MATRRFFFQDENLVAGLSDATLSTQAGVSNIDDGAVIEKGLLIPFSDDPATTWLDYRCRLEVHLDAGLALHKPLPQGTQGTDDLGVVDVDDPEAMADNKGGVNWVSQGHFTDIIQRCATSEYRFCLRGFGLRVAFQVPIPKLVKVAGVGAFPAERQVVLGPELVGNYGGVPLWYAEWEKWYYVALPPNKAQTAPANLAAFARGDGDLPDGVQVPYGVPDQNSVAAAPSSGPGLVGFITTGGGQK